MQLSIFHFHTERTNNNKNLYSIFLSSVISNVAASPLFCVHFQMINVQPLIGTWWMKNTGNHTNNQKNVGKKTKTRDSRREIKQNNEQTKNIYSRHIGLICTCGSDCLLDPSTQRFSRFYAMDVSRERQNSKSTHRLFYHRF